MLNKGSSDQLFVKALVQTSTHQHTSASTPPTSPIKAQGLDVTLPVAVPAGTRAMVYDDRAWDWRRPSTRCHTPTDGVPLHGRQVPALGAWLVLIPVTPRPTGRALELPAAPVQLSPVPDGAVTDGLPSFAWQAADPGARYRWRSPARRSSARRTASYWARDHGHQLYHDVPLTAKWRYFWRVCTVDAQGRRGPGARRAPSSTAGRNIRRPIRRKKILARRAAAKSRRSQPVRSIWPGWAKSGAPAGTCTPRPTASTARISATGAIRAVPLVAPPSEDAYLASRRA